MRRDSIINIAEGFFIEYGFDDAKIDDIAEEAGYTKATIYNYFESKDDLYAAVLAKTYKRMQETFEGQLSADYSVRALGDSYLSFVNKYPHQSAFIDSGKCVTLNRIIINKKQNNEALTESEIEFTENETSLSDLMVKVIKNSAMDSGIDNPQELLKIVKSLAALNPAIREVVRKGKVFGQSDEEIKETLGVLFSIIELGIRNYNSGL